MVKVSFKLVKGHWWETLCFEFVCFCLSALLFVSPYIILGFFVEGESDPTFVENVIGDVWMGLAWTFVLVSGRVWFMRLEKIAKSGGLDRSDAADSKEMPVGQAKDVERTGSQAIDGVEKEDKIGLFADWRKSRIGVIPNLIIYIIWPLVFLVLAYKFHAFVRHHFADSFLTGGWFVPVLWLTAAIITMWYNGKKYCRDYVYGNVLRFLISFIVGCMIYGTFFK